MKSCNTCFYKGPGEFSICTACLGQSSIRDSFPMWVSQDFLMHVEDSRDPPSSIKWTTEQLTGYKETNKQGIKYDQDKPVWSLLPFRAVKEVVDVLTSGAKKYSPDNWKIVPNARQRYVDAAFRHFVDWQDGEKKDKETGKSHLAHAVCCLLFLLWFEQEDECAPLKK